jgi:hypothetical protein
MIVFLVNTTEPATVKIPEKFLLQIEMPRNQINPKCVFGKQNDRIVIKMIGMTRPGSCVDFPVNEPDSVSSVHLPDRYDAVNTLSGDTKCP